MDLRNYGVIDFAEHVVLPSGDADDADDLDDLDGSTLVGYNYNPFTRGKKAKKIEELHQQIANLKEENDHTQRLLTAQTAELAESNKIIVNIEANLKNVESERDIAVENWSLYRKLHSEKTTLNEALNRENMRLKLENGKKLNTLKSNIAHILKSENVDENDVAERAEQTYNAWRKGVSENIETSIKSINDRMAMYHRTYKKVLLNYIRESIIAREIQTELHELANT